MEKDNPDKIIHLKEIYFQLNELKSRIYTLEKKQTNEVKKSVHSLEKDLNSKVKNEIKFLLSKELEKFFAKQAFSPVSYQTFAKKDFQQGINLIKLFKNINLY